VDATGNVGQFPSLAIGADGLPVMRTSTTLIGPQSRQVWQRRLRGGNTLTTVDATGAVGFYPSLAIGADGLPVIAYYGDTDLKVAKCTNAACTGAITPTIVDATGTVGYYPRSPSGPRASR